MHFRDKYHQHHHITSPVFDQVKERDDKHHVDSRRSFTVHAFNVCKCA